MSNPKRSGAAAAGWLLTLAGTVALGTLTYGVLATDYRRARLLSLLQGDAGFDGISAQGWLILVAPILIIGLGVAMIAASEDRSPVR